MKNSLLQLLVSPCCHATLDAPAMPCREGTLVCRVCRREYPLREGLPRFTGEDIHKTDRETRETFGFQWWRYPAHLLEEEEKDFLDDTQISPETWKGKTTLDAGCGMGRYARAAARFGAKVVGVDLSSAADRAAELLPEADFLQAPLEHLPFAPETFDIIYSVGVLHHTRDPKTSFLSITRLVKPGGLLSVWLYGTAGRYKDFRTNPLKNERAVLKKIAPLWWLTVKVRETLSDTLRKLTPHLPRQCLWSFCVVLAGVGKIPFLKYLTYSVHPSWKVRTQQNFDWLSPPCQSHHTKEEVLSWFKEAGFAEITMAPHGMIPKVALKGRKGNEKPFA